MSGRVYQLRNCRQCGKLRSVSNHYNRKFAGLCSEECKILNRSATYSNRIYSSKLDGNLENIKEHALKLYDNIKRKNGWLSLEDESELIEFMWCVHNPCYNYDIYVKKVQIQMFIDYLFIWIDENCKNSTI